MASTCAHPASNGPCQREVGDGVEFCFMHLGSGPPPGHGAPPGDNHAVSNAGGGAPKGNINAMTHGAFSD
ncbi:hypothetical protein SAMN04487948_11123 [Halogranum amylolyticum]|uniref:Uncharacterized protein n=1 Tax=Halogranum amylolyticum TaxID=660520 RepID=A0A1H8UH46_9EURY|nr:hypothetical protein SAMN04487948_11123 [Halogranum amylolyticum]